MRLATVAVVGFGLATGCPDPGDRFTCGDDGACVYQGARGRCEPGGSCSFPDATCPSSGRRYGAWAAPEVRGLCAAPAVDGSAPPDGASPADLAQPDLAPPPDLAAPPDLSGPCGALGQPCCASGCAGGAQCVDAYCR
jgi:hypothetical protein